MPRGKAKASATLSLLERLIDTDPRAPADTPVTASDSVQALKRSLRRDLEWLLNTRRIAVEPEESLREVNRSLYLYGLPDFSVVSLADPRDHKKLVRTLQNAVKLFEPRLANVRILPLESAYLNSRTLQFRIEGLLRMEPAPEFVSFDTVLDLTSGAYEVKGGANAG